MAYLIQKDYNLPIQDTHLQQMISADPLIQSTAESWAQARIISHLVQKYDVEQEFTDTGAFSALVAYNANDRVVYINELYYVTPPAPAYNFNTIYETGDSVLYEKNTYTAKTSNKGILPTSESYWIDNGVYSVTINTLPTDATKWTKGDNRSAEIVQCMTDLALFRILQRVSPRMIQQSRKDAYNESMAWLKDCAEGVLTLDFPLKQLKQGFRIRFNSSPKNPNTY